MNFNQFLKATSKISNLELPAEASQFKMSPPFRGDLLQNQQGKIKNAKQSAVLALFYPDEAQETKFVLILRKTYKGVHSAQVGFPGGKVEVADTSLKHTALRETEEEIGVPM
ncbi:MAG: NUDIX domain-containing protein, partial [Oceanihabitans sp.]|nr:NUDIX domain-containing protein [Oceanihabitans sp.]